MTEAENLAMYEQGPYTITRLTEDDVVSLAAGLANAKVKAMALNLLSLEEELQRNADKPVRVRRRK